MRTQTATRETQTPLAAQATTTTTTAQARPPAQQHSTQTCLTSRRARKAGRQAGAGTTQTRSARAALPRAGKRAARAQGCGVRGRGARGARCAGPRVDARDARLAGHRTRSGCFFFSSPLLCPLALCPLAGFGAMGMARRREDAGMVLANVQRQWRFATAPLGVEQGGNSSCTPIASLSLSPYVPAHSRCTTGPFASNCANHRAISLVTTVARSPIGRAHPKALDWRLGANGFVC